MRGHIDQRFACRWICVSCNRENGATLYRADPGIRAAQRRRKQRDREKANAQRRLLHQLHPEKMRQQNRQKRAQKAGARGNFTAADEATLRAYQKHCHICGKRFTKGDPATIDHVIALADGGPHDPNNIALAHLSCNCSKQDKRTHLL